MIITPNKKGAAPAAEPRTLTADEKEIVPPEVMKAEDLRLKGELDDALKIISDYLNDHYENVPALVMAGNILADAKRMGLAQAMFKLCSKLRPESAMIWSNLGFTYQEGCDEREGEACFLKAIQRNPNDAMAWNNLSQLYVNIGQPMKALNCAEKAIRLNKNLVDANYNRGLAHLQMGNFEEGWKGYEHNLGKHKWRKERIYGIVPRWTGVKGLKLVAYGEQGIGDEISFASCIPDLMKENEVIIECDSRLHGLFHRSFGCKTFGTRFQNGISWPLKHDIDASVAFGSLPKYYRNKNEDFPGTPYLKADPERRLMFRSLLDSLGPRKKIGIAWSGGLKETGSLRRSILLYDLMPILRQDADFISLQYRDADEVIMIEENHDVKVHHWPWAVMSKDYDNTAALVAELDLVITVTQACVHLSGSLGIPCWVMVPKAPMWRYQMTGDKMPWYNSVKLYRQKTEWVHVISDVAHDLREWLNK